MGEEVQNCAVSSSLCRRRRRRRSVHGLEKKLESVGVPTHERGSERERENVGERVKRREGRE